MVNFMSMIAYAIFSSSFINLSIWVLSGYSMPGTMLGALGA